MTIEIELRGRINACETQRNRALADHAIAEGCNAVALADKAQLQAANAELEKKVAALEKRVAELTPPPAPTE